MVAATCEIQSVHGGTDWKDMKGASKFKVAVARSMAYREQKTTLSEVEIKNMVSKSRPSITEADFVSVSRCYFLCRSNIYQHHELTHA